jgi:hypothetical protein
VIFFCIETKEMWGGVNCKKMWRAGDWIVCAGDWIELWRAGDWIELWCAGDWIELGRAGDWIELWYAGNLESNVVCREVREVKQHTPTNDITSITLILGVHNMELIE